MIGTSLGPYQVTARIGEGGMGEVYRATDTNLKRLVALKVLAPAFVRDGDRLARFRREAEVLAALNHPNIAAIYGLEKTPDVTALVMELVEGEDLSVILARGALPTTDALAIARQLTDALETAHEQGIIHRDLKPANIKIRADGTVKVLDFGLAKVAEATEGSGGTEAQSTMTSPAMTAKGVILGTAAYMAPEQARGKSVDKRADIWAFGVVLYEMLTGRRAFKGQDVSDLLVAVLTTDVDLTALPAGTPPRIRALIRDCLVRDPKQRLRDIGDARRILDGADDVPAPHQATPPPAAARRPLAWMAVLALALVAAVALAIPAMRHLGESPPAETRTDIVTPATMEPASFALSPDGRQIVFVASANQVSRLWLRTFSTTAAQPLAGTEGAIYPFWSPEGRALGFFAGGALKRLDLGGGTPQTLAPAVSGTGGTWNAQGDIVFAPSTAGPLMRVAPTGGAVTAVTTLAPGQSGHYHPQFLPDGRRLIFKVGGSSDNRGIYLGGLNAGTQTRLTTGVASGVYSPAGFLIWIQAGSLVAQRLDVERAVLTGSPVTLEDGVAPGSAFRSAVSVAATGLIAYRSATAANRQLTWFSRSGAPMGVVGEPEGSLNQPRVLPDGSRIAVTRLMQDATDVWLLEAGRATRLTLDPDNEFLPVLSLDGSRIAYLSTAAPIGLYQKSTNGAGAEEPLLATGQVMSPSSWSPDNRYLMYSTADSQASSDIWVLPTSGERKPFVFLKTPFREGGGMFSPDGRWVAYQSNASGRTEIYVRPFSQTAAGQWQISSAGGIDPVWRFDGRELYFLNPHGALMAASITVNGTSVVSGAPVMLFQTRIVGGGDGKGFGRQYDVTRDGRFLVNTQLNDDAPPIRLLQNWNR